MSPWLPKAEFDAIYSKVPRLTVEVIVQGEGGIILTKRQIPPCAGSWHVPGGTVQFGEPVDKAVKRIANDELGFAVDINELLGYIEYPSHYKAGQDSPVGLAFLVTTSGHIQLQEVAAWFTEVPSDMHPDQDQFLLKHNLLKWGQDSSVFPHAG